jgi:hypothetical protein
MSVHTMIYNYRLGQVIKIHIKNHIKYAVIIRREALFDKPLYEYIIQGSEGKTYFDYERDLDVRVLRATIEILEEQVKEIK